MMAQNEQTTEEHSTLDQQSPGRNVGRVRTHHGKGHFCRHTWTCLRPIFATLYARRQKRCCPLVRAYLAAVGVVSSDVWGERDVRVCPQLAVDSQRFGLEHVQNSMAQPSFTAQRHSLTVLEPRRLYILCWREHSRRKLSPTLATAYCSCPDNASSPMRTQQALNWASPGGSWADVFTHP